MRLLPLLLALVLTACTAGNAPASPTLAGSEWVLKSMPGWEMQQAPQIPTLHFQSDAQVGGRSGCNTWGGGYELKGTSIRFGQMRSTLMACAYGMDVETRFHDLLKRARTLSVDGDTLTLADETGTTLATFFRASKAVPP
jgi:heat shock protein HslJ